MTEHSFDPSMWGLARAPDASVYLPDDAATRAFGACLARHVSPGDVVALVGNLGAGKTTFTQGFCAELGVDRATSPTYTLLNHYRGEVDLFHFDLYRLETVGDLEGVGYWDYVESGTGVAIVEWADQIPEAWTGTGAVVELLHSDQGRTARVWSPDSALVESVGNLA